MSKPLFIDQPQALRDSAQAWREASWLAVDTEFVRTDTYFARLCLVQVSDGRHAGCVDALGLDLAPLWETLAAASVTKVMHSAGQDLELFVQHTGDCPRPLFDTQIAMALLGGGEQLGYAGLVEQRLGVKVDKSLARTDWSRRPLPPAALAYAADDVRHLAELYPALRAELEARGRLAWLEEECARIVDPALYRVEPAQAWRYIKGLSRLAPAAQHRAARLAAWRETEARERNRPRRWILDDGVICRLAGHPPDSATALSGIEGFPARLAARAGEAIVELLRLPVSEATPVVTGRRLAPEEKQRFEALQAAIRDIARREQISQTLIATRSDLEAVACAGSEADVPLMRGWRRQVAGQKLLAALQMSS